MKEVETIVFVPALPDSSLRKLLQSKDEDLCRTTNTPTARFIERGGTTLVELVGRNNPWAKEWTCPRQDCLPCQGRMILAAEAEEEAAKMLDKTEKVTKTRKEDRKSTQHKTETLHQGIANR